MERTSTANDLTDRLRSRLESERRAIEELTASELTDLRRNRTCHPVSVQVERLQICELTDFRRN